MQILKYIAYFIIAIVIFVIAAAVNMVVITVGSAIGWLVTIFVLLVIIGEGVKSGYDSNQGK
jgi:hypothetical protein